MKKGSYLILVLLRNGVCILLGAWLVLVAPTGWLYDLWAGEGTGQGQRPTKGVRQLQRQEEVETSFLTRVPVTVPGGELTVCPLTRLRDMDQEGVHYKRGPGRLSAYVSEYITAEYPLSFWDKAVQGLVSGFYNRYYLIELEDGSSLCVYFDDYLALSGTEEYPTGYLRYTTTEERRILNRMSEDHDVNPVYVLDMYRHGKVNWMLDLALRVGVLAVVAILVTGLQTLLKKRKPAQTEL